MDLNALKPALLVVLSPLVVGLLYVALFVCVATLVEPITLMVAGAVEMRSPVACLAERGEMKRAAGLGWVIALMAGFGLPRVPRATLDDASVAYALACAWVGYLYGRTLPRWEAAVRRTACPSNNATRDPVVCVLFGRCDDAEFLTMAFVVHVAVHLAVVACVGAGGYLLWRHRQRTARFHAPVTSRLLSWVVLFVLVYSFVVWPASVLTAHCDPRAQPHVRDLAIDMFLAYPLLVVFAASQYLALNVVWIQRAWAAVFASSAGCLVRWEWSRWRGGAEASAAITEATCVALVDQGDVLVHALPVVLMAAAGWLLVTSHK